MINIDANVVLERKLRRGDFHTDGRQHYFQLDEKGGRQRTIPGWSGRHRARKA